MKVLLVAHGWPDELVGGTENATQALARRFEQIIRAAPTQWHMLQPNWPSDREAT